MVIRDSGRFTGSVSGGCVEADLVERAKSLLRGGEGGVVQYGVSDSDAFEVGLSCGGQIDVWLEEADPALWREVRALLDDDAYGTLYTNTHTGEKRLERGVLDPTGLREDGVFAERIEGPLRVMIFGAAEAAEHLCAYGRQLGWRTTVVDARPALATPERVPSADEVIKAWPDQVVDRIDERTAVVTLSHEERLDIPAIAAALERGARYIGAIGAKRTQERRRAALARAGVRRRRDRPYPRPCGARPRRARARAGRTCDCGRDRAGDRGRSGSGHHSGLNLTTEPDGPPRTGICSRSHWHVWCGRGAAVPCDAGGGRGAGNGRRRAGPCRGSG